MTLWKVPPGGVRLTDELSRPRTPCGVRPRDRDTGGAASTRTTRSPRSRLPRQRCLIRLRSDEPVMPAVYRRAAVQPDTGPARNQRRRRRRKRSRKLRIPAGAPMSLNGGTRRRSTGIWDAATGGRTSCFRTPSQSFSGCCFSSPLRRSTLPASTTCVCKRDSCVRLPGTNTCPDVPH